MHPPDAQAVLDAAVRTLRNALPAAFFAVGARADERLPIPAADRALVDKAVAHRRAEFVAGRWCAHEALKAAALPAVGLPTGPLGAPCWPSGAIGSITHDAGHCVAIAGPAAGVSGVGIDWCEDSRLAGLSELADQILADREQQAFRHGGATARQLQRIFCAKEAVVKAASSAVGRFLELRDIHVVDEGGNGGAFHAHIASHSFAIRGWHLPAVGHALALAWLAA
ncbi:MAG TPA: 4'-phosphopantetheinyl transferase superfamily protein [Aquabacterium sp.]|nr:4'-phosphopantetheinyl transferase superfamily protein [Aquabacterium sp.]